MRGSWQRMSLPFLSDKSVNLVRFVGVSVAMAKRCMLRDSQGPLDCEFVCGVWRLAGVWHRRGPHAASYTIDNAPDRRSDRSRLPRRSLASQLHTRRINVALASASRAASPQRASRDKKV